MPDSDVVTRAEAAALLGVDKSTIRKYERTGRLPAASFQTRPGSVQRRAYYPKAAVTELKVRLEAEALNRRSEAQKRHDFERELADQKLHDERIAREDAAAEFERAESKKKADGERQAREADAEARASKAEYDGKIAYLERRQRELDDALHVEVMAAEQRMLVVKAVAPVVLLGLAAWVANTSEPRSGATDAPTPVPAEPEAGGRSLRDIFEALGGEEELARMKARLG